MLELC